MLPARNVPLWKPLRSLHRGDTLPQRHRYRRLRGNDGAPVIAAASGTVITASYDSAYGNYVIIDHGGTSTVYAHMSGLAVYEGQTVSQGQEIGYVGSTGRATGTHLHFEVYVGDSRVDPAQYFSGISYYNC